MKCFGGRAIVALRDSLSKLHGSELIPEQPARGESQANGRAEEAVKTTRGFIKVLKFQLEDKAQMELQGNEDIIGWMVRWGAMVCSRFLVGKDGRTGIERRRGRKCDIPVIPFGEAVEYLEIREHKEHNDKGVTELREGIWLGHARQRNETIVGTPEGVVRASDVRR